VVVLAHLFGVDEVLDQMLLSKVTSEIAGSYPTFHPSLKLHPESTLCLEIRNTLLMELSKSTSGLKENNNKLLLMIDSLSSMNLKVRKMDFMVQELQKLMVLGGLF
tara:strand:+ start:783 stop:1100 length:318 start_codon:yes stop_codon:yes gene_type:complete